MIKIIGDNIEELHLINELLEIGRLNCSDDIINNSLDAAGTNNLDVCFSLKDGREILSTGQSGNPVIIGYKSEDGEYHFLDKFKYLEGK